MTTRKPWEVGLLPTLFKESEVEFRLTPDLWLAQADDRILALNALSGRRLLLPPSAIEEMLEFCRAQELRPDPTPLSEQLIQADILTTLAVDRQLLKDKQEPLRKTVQRFLADLLKTTRRKVRLRFETDVELIEQALQMALENSKRTDPEAVRDLSSLFRNAKTFLQSSPPESSFSPGFLERSWQRPDAQQEYGQLPCLPQSSLKRVRFGVTQVSDPATALMLGDDDLLSLAWLDLTADPCHTFELDQRLLRLLEKHKSPKLELFERDLTQGLPHSHRHSYSLVFSDPPYNAEGMDLFLKCCSEGLSRDGQARILLSTRPDLIEAGEQLKQRLNNLGLHIERHEVDFSRYLWPAQLARRAFQSLRGCGLPTHLMTSLLQVPLYHSDLLVLCWKEGETNDVV